MKQYDHIYVPNELGFFGIRRFDDDTDAPIEVEDADKVQGVIVLTIEELEAMWKAAEANGEIKGLQQVEYMLGTETTNFETYIQLKGIQPT